MKTDFIPPNAYRVKLSTNRHQNEAIERRMEESVRQHADSSLQDISLRIKALDREWDTERILEANASAIMLISTGLGYYISPWWFILTGLVAFYLLQHAIQGWCPPLPVIRKFGVRTMSEINAEKTALKIIRGDFDNMKSEPLKILKTAE